MNILLEIYNQEDLIQPIAAYITLTSEVMRKIRARVVASKSCAVADVRFYEASYFDYFHVVDKNEMGLSDSEENYLADGSWILTKKDPALAMYRFDTHRMHVSRDGSVRYKAHSKDGVFEITTSNFKLEDVLNG